MLIMQAPTEIFEAIALQKCLKVTYNKMVVTLAPHILYTRHDEMYIDAVTTDRDGRPPRELKLGTFKLGAPFPAPPPARLARRYFFSR